MVSPGMEQAIKILRDAQAQGPAEPTVEDIRQGLEMLGAISIIPRGLKRHKEEIGSMKALWLTIPEITESKAILYLHGGGYVAGSIKTHRELVGRIALASQAPALLIDYRLAPENPFPAALEDAVAAYQWLQTNKKIPPEKIIIAGDSAGGGLTVATLVKLRDDHQPLPAAAVLLSPWTDLARTGDSIGSKAELDPFIDAPGLKQMVDWYIGGEDEKNPLISPLYADLNGLPPLLIHVGTFEILLDDSIRLAENAKTAGVNTKLEIWEDCIHVFQAFASMCPEGGDAIEKIGNFIQKIV